MAGLYIHIPFCSKRCLYCDFYSQTDRTFIKPYIDALCQEIRIRRDYLGKERLETIYLGGGTPSLLSANDLQQIFDTISTIYNISDLQEITLEANPDDLTPAYIDSLHTLPINRISMGIQSFHNQDLYFLNRRHNSQQAIQAVNNCQQAGFENISIDLIYGLPGQTLEAWKENLQIATSLHVPHLSAYHLIYEEGTALYKKLEAGEISPIDEELSVELFTLLIDTLQTAGYQHYEISNFAWPNHYARHNSSYWTGTPYIGIGPSAHSYNGESRQWNVSSISAYMEGIRHGKPNYETEQLNPNTRYNETIITGLRTMWGVSLKEIKRLYGTEKLAFFEKQCASFIHQGLLKQTKERIILTRKGIFISDRIMSDLLWI